MYRQTTNAHGITITCTIYFLIVATGTGVDIYILAEGIDFDNEEFGGRASHGEFMPENDCAKYGTELASLAAGKDYGVAKNATIYR